MEMGTVPMTEDGAGSLTSRLAMACQAMTYDDLSERVRNRSKLIVLDTLGAMLSASRPTFPGVRHLSEFVLAESQGGPSVVVGTALRTGPTYASLMNGYLAYALDIESHHGAAVVHAAASVVPAVLAVAGEVAADGPSVLAAVVLGIDVACRVSLAIGPNDLYHRGFHPTSVAGSFGAAVAAGTLLRLDANQIEAALGLAATATGGLLAWANDETEESRPLNPGLAARNGVSAARLAALGFGAPRAIFDAGEKYNAFRAWSLDGMGAPRRLLDGFGESFAIEELIIKRHACCAFLHPAVDGMLGILEDESLSAEDLAGITISFPRSGAPIINHNPLRSHRAQYILPVAAVRRRIDFTDVITDRSAETTIHRLADATEFVEDDDLDRFYPERYATKLTVTTRQGAVHTRRIDWARGTPENPMGDAEIVAKFRRLAGERDGPIRGDRIADLVLELERLDNVHELFQWLSVS